MLDKMLIRMRIREAKVQAGDGAETTHPNHYSGMRVYQRLDSTRPREPHRLEKLETKWQIPLPYDLIITIINLYFLDDKLALANLTKTCRNLAQICRPLCYQFVVITSRRNLKGLSESERFATLLSQSPHLIDYVQHLKIHASDLRMFQGSRPITPEEESLCYILTRKYSNLRRLHLFLHVVWSLLPIQLQHAFSVTFTLANLQEVVFEHVNISTSLLTHLGNISDLEVRDGEVLSRSMDVEIPSRICTPKRLLFMDHSRTGFITKNLFAETSALRLSKLEHLQIYACGIHLKLLSEPLQACATTLTNLDFRVSTWGGVPDVVDLGRLSVLTSLTLSADISMMPYGNPGVDGPRRFAWLVDTLATCCQPSRIETIKLIILTREFSFAKDLHWKNLDSLFTPYPEIRWPQLNRIIVQHFNENKESIKRYKVGTLEKIVLSMTPILSAADLIRFTISGEYLRFWRL
ncbi:hypothetical protein M413DRAFT_31008 [Hebeloma cylindrosporum]|uniref:F-box domain-containing protein n=1 Tax=Hebeloma cylindrosporum TaxID=76867 RepID=A0A0C3C0U1_HEBCY|nr:hypothetical protein M413DRAFT_31008 [Hebeloma cylindrosporum h7]